MKRIPLLLLVVLCTNSLFGQNIGIINDCVKGKFKVGFTHLTLSDYSRKFNKVLFTFCEIAHSSFDFTQRIHFYSIDVTELPFRQ